MYMRFVQAKIKPERLAELRKQYDERVIPALQATKGCLYASLIRSEHHAGECVSMTLWEDRYHAEAYERSGVFAGLMQEAAPYLVDSSEWKIHLSDDLKLEY